MFSPASLTFLRGLNRNNRKDWFEAHRDAYERDVREPLRGLVDELDVRFATFAPEIVGDRKRSIFRIYRDIRFSKDKSPYKTHVAAWFFHRSATKAVGKDAHDGGAGFYFHLEPGQSLVAGGLWMPERTLLRRVRDAIVDDPAAFERTMSSPAFRRRFRGLTREAMLTRPPRGYPADHPAQEWLRFQSFTTSHRLSDAEALSKRLPDRLVKDYETMLPLVRWLNRAGGYLPATSR
jgi:uncharacterized protein (TIGR02453 family)